MQAQLASGYVGQSVKIALGKAFAPGRLSYIESPTTGSGSGLSMRQHHGFPVSSSSYWPGSHHGRLVMEMFPKTGPLSHPHYLLRKHVEKRSGHHDLPKAEAVPSSELSIEKSLPSSSESHSIYDAEPQYNSTPRGTLLSLTEHAAYHDARLKGASYICQVPQPGSVPVATRTALEATKSIVAADADMKLASTGPRAVFASYEASNLKPQRRQIMQRVSGASNNFFRETMPPYPRDAPYRSANDRLIERFEKVFGYETFSIDDVLCLQRSIKDPNGDPYDYLPPITTDDILNYETKYDAAREFLESRWSIFCEKTSGAQTPSRSPLFQLHSPSNRQFMHRLSLNMQFSRRDELSLVAEELKTCLKDARRANPFFKPKRTASAPKPPPSLPQLVPEVLRNPEHEIKFSPNETWPLVLDSDQNSLPSHLAKLWKDELSRAVLTSLVLFASTTLDHPIPPSLVNLLGQTVLQPLGYNANPAAAQLILTQLGMPVIDPIDLPFIFQANLPEPEGESRLPYPWLSANAYNSLEDVAQATRNHVSSDTPALSSLSPRQNTVDSFSDIPASMSSEASRILEQSVASELPTYSDSTKSWLHDLIDASKSPRYHFSKNISTRTSGLQMPSLLTDSASMLSSFDLDRETRVDLSALPSYAIDDKSTTEVDDAFALDASPLETHYDWIVNHLLEYVSTTTPGSTVPSPPASLPKTARIFIHIADPTAVMRVGDELEMGARERVETLYLPHRKSFMLPSILSEFVCSLQPHPHMNVALTFEAHVNLLTGALERMETYPSKFCKMSRISYETTQSILNGDLVQEGLGESDSRALKLLWVIAQLRTRWRKHDGLAENMQLLKTGVKVIQPGSKAFSSGAAMMETNKTKTTIELYNENTNRKSRSLVEEMMVLVGEITGRTAHDHNIPVPYRSQPLRSFVHLPPLVINNALKAIHDPMMPTASSVLECDVSRLNLVHNLQSLNWLLTSNTSANPASHRSLGLPFYSRASSPLRRYADIISHFQLKAWRRYGGDLSKLPYSPSLVHSLSKHINHVSKDIKYSQQQSERWWKQQYVLRHGMDRTWDAIVFNAPNLHSVSLNLSKNKPFQYSFCILELDTIVFLPAPAHLEVGQIVKLLPNATSEIHLEWTVLAPELNPAY